MDGATREWARDERDLFRRLRAHAFDNPDIAFDFTHRLARTLDWTLDHARDAIEEYRRFCFLACVTPTPVTPSEEVDEVWHLHLTYTRDYWDRWCGKALGRTLHHDPTSGGSAEDEKYRRQYAATLAHYEGYFGPPPAAFWPSTQKRFAARPRYRMIDGDQTIVLRKPSLASWRLPGFAALATIVTGTPARAQNYNPLDWTGEQFLALYVLCLVGAFVFLVFARSYIRETKRPANTKNLSPVAIGYLADGKKRAADTLYVELARHGAAKLFGQQIEISRSAGTPPPDLDAYRRDLHGIFRHRELVSCFGECATTGSLVRDLKTRNLLMSDRRLMWQTAATLAIILPVLFFGFAKIAVGVSRDKPVGFLVAMILVAVVLMLIVIFKDRGLTDEGDNALRMLREQFSRAARAPQDHELALAVAFGGVAVLAGTYQAAYAQVSAPPSSGSGCGTSGCGGDGGSGCSGGGCGGCGGGGGD